MMPSLYIVFILLTMISLILGILFGFQDDKNQNRKIIYNIFFMISFLSSIILSYSSLHIVTQNNVIFKEVGLAYFFGAMTTLILVIMIMVNFLDIGASKWLSNQ